MCTRPSDYVVGGCTKTLRRKLKGTRREPTRPRYGARACAREQPTTLPARAALCYCPAIAALPRLPRVAPNLTRRSATASLLPWVPLLVLVGAGTALAQTSPTPSLDPRVSPTAPDPRPVPLYDELDYLEREAVVDALEALGLRLDASPEGKRIGELHVVTREVFDQGKFPSFLNVFHATTRPSVVREELLFARGDTWDAAVVRESQRNLRLRETLSVVAIVPVESATAGTVDVLVVTRDTWSLRINTDFTFADGVLDSLLLALVEENLLGQHKRVGISSLYEQDTFQIGPTFADPRFLHTRFTVTEDFRFVINHQEGGLEGVLQYLEVGLPLYSLDSRWGVSFSQYLDTSVFRDFAGSRVRTWDDPETPAEEAVPFSWRQYIAEYQLLGALRAGQGTAWRHDLRFGHGVTDREFTPTADLDPATRQAFEARVLPRSEVASFARINYQGYRASYRSVTRYQTFGFAEDLRVGPSLEVDLRYSPRALGSTTTFVQGATYLGYRGASEPGWIGDLVVGAGARWETASAEVIDRFVTLSSHLALPPFGPVRLHIGGGGTLRLSRVTQPPETLGGDTGLRGYPVGAFVGDSTLLGHVELRTLPAFSILGVYFAGALFFDVGTIFEEGGSAELLSDVGLGLRVLAPQSSRLLYRVDYAFPTSGPSGFLPGSLSFGIGQVF